MAKALSYELENKDNSSTLKETQALMNEILQNLPAENSTSNFVVNWIQDDTVDLEFVQLLNLR